MNMYLDADLDSYIFKNTLIPTAPYIWAIRDHLFIDYNYKL